jgi:hypothetical protein
MAASLPELSFCVQLLALPRTARRNKCYVGKVQRSPQPLCKSQMYYFTLQRENNILNPLDV